MFGSTIEMITLIASNSLIVFCFCNLIIVSLLVGGLKPPSKFVQENQISATVARRNKRGSGEGIEAYSSSKVESEVEELQVENEINETVDQENKYLPNVISELDDLLGESERNDGEEEEHDGDELRKRVEEFIDRINTSWKAEKIRSSLVV